jgi:hypothetical protein
VRGRHPCEGHACDHCHSCDVLAVCCRGHGARSADVRVEALLAAISADNCPSSPLLAAITCDATAGALDRLSPVASDLQPTVVRRALATARVELTEALAPILEITTGKERVHDRIPRT